MSIPQRNHTRLHTNSLQLRTAEFIRTPRQLGPVDTLIDRHLSRMDSQNLRARLLVRERELDLPVQTTGSE
jgi:hypothetical protein